MKIAQFFENLENRQLFAASLTSAEVVAKQVGVLDAIYDAMITVAGGKVNVVGVANGLDVKIESKELKLSDEAAEQLRQLGTSVTGNTIEGTEITVDGQIVSLVIQPPALMSIPLSSRRIADKGITTASVGRSDESNAQFGSSLTDEILG